MKGLSREFSTVIGVGLFEKDNEVLLESLSKIVKKDFLTGVKVTDPLKNHIESKGLTSNYFLKKEYPINVRIKNQKEMIGYIVFYSDESVLYSLFKNEFVGLWIDVCKI